MTAAKSNPAQAKARERLQALSISLRRAAKHPSEADSIHRLRVAIRRFTQVLRVFGSGFEHTRRMRRHLRGLMDLCGAVRNCDIAVEVLAEAGAPAHAGLKGRLKRRRVRVSRQLAKLLKDGDLRAHMRRWRGWLTGSSGEPPPAPAMLSLESREFLRSGSAAARADADYPQMHEFRLMVKKLRYTLEILGSGGAQLARLRALQERLGAINDCVTTTDLIAEMKLGTAEQRRIKAALNRLLARRAAQFRVYWRANFGRKGSAH
jgi:CHAD domain-containing protein